MSENSLKPPAFDPAGAAAAAARFSAAAAADVDIAYTHVDSPLGPLLLAATHAGLVRISFFDDDAVLDELARRVSPRILEAPARLDRARRELDEYFAGTRMRFDLPLDWVLASDFSRRILTATAAIEFGQTGTYGGVAAAAGNPKAARAAGRALNTNPIPVVVPCHRIVGANGALVGYAGGLERKLTLLELEGRRP
jgi:methylated-DNA-[protein]-cysteine S-methyltransferase